MRVQQWLDRWGDAALAAAIAVESELELAHVAPGHLRATGGRPAVAALILMVTLPLAWRRSRPVAALAVMVGALAVAGAALTRSDGVPLGVFVALLVAFYSVGANCDERRALLGGGAALAGVAAIDLGFGIFQQHGARPGAWVACGVAWLVGREVRRRRLELLLLREQADRLQADQEAQARSAVSDERNRIARELHDVVAHSVSVMVVQAQAGTRLLGEPDQARGAFQSIESAGREALVELRRLLGILRAGDEQLAIGPQPGLGSLGALVDQVRDAGLEVAVRIEGEPAPLPPGIDLSAYRIVQEALTNTLKHVGRAESQIVLRYGTAALELEVTDNGSGNGADPAAAGHGLIGMRERVALYGGVLETGSRSGGGYTVRARLPLARGAGA